MPILTPKPSGANPLVTDTRAFPRALQAEFLRTLAQWGNVRAAAKAVGVARTTAYRMRRECLTFQELWDAALLHARPLVEEVLADRALNGVQESVYYHGEEVATRTRYDSRLLLAHLGRLDRLEQNRRVLDAMAGFDLQVAELAEAPEWDCAPEIDEAQIGASEIALFDSGNLGDDRVGGEGAVFPCEDSVPSVPNAP